MATDTRTLKVVVVGDSTSAQRSIRDVGREADGLKTKSATLAVALGNLASQGASKLLDLAGSAITTGIKTASGFQQSQVAFTNMLGSGEKATAFLDKIKTMAAQTPFEFPDLTRASQRLLAMGFAAKDVIPTLTAAGDAVAAMGGGKEQINQVVTALGQMQAKGKIAGDEILQMTEVGIPALKILADGYGVTTGEMSGMISEGEVMADKALPMLVAGLENGTKHTQAFGGMMAAQSQTLAGKWSTLTDTVTVGLGNMFTKAMPAMNAGIDFLSNAATKVFSGIPGIIGPVAKFIKDLFVVDIIPAAQSMWTVVGPLVTQLGGLLVTLWEKAKPLDGIKAIFAGIREGAEFMKEHAATFQTLAVAIGVAVAAYQLYIATTKIGTVVTELVTGATAAWNAVLALNPIGLVVAAIAALVAGVIYAYTHFEGFRKVVDTVWAAIKSATQTVVSWFMSYVWPTLQTVFNLVKSAVMFLVDLWIAEFKLVQTVVTAVVNFFKTWIWPGIKAVFDLIADAVKVVQTVFEIGFGIMQIAAKALVYLFQTYVWPLLKPLFDLIGAAVHTLGDVFSTIFNAIKDKVSEVVNWFKGTAWPILESAFEIIKSAVTTLWNMWKSNFDLIKDKIESVMKGAVTAFDNAKTEIGKVWDKLRDLAKTPVNFVIETVYNHGIAAFWNAIADKVDAKPLPILPKLAAGREIPSVPGIAGDWVPFYGQAGEVVLNRRQVAMAGGVVGLESMFGPFDRSGASSGHYAGGGILGGLAGAVDWLKDKGSALVKGSLLTVAEPLINSIKAGISEIPGTGAIADAVRKLPTMALDSILAWLKPKDVAPADGAAGPIGAVGEIPAWVTHARDTSSFGHNSGVGAWLFNVVKAAGLANTNYGIFQVRKTATGNLSMHGYGRAVDLPPSMATFNFLRANYGSRLKELIYSPAGGFQIYNGQNHMYTGVTRDMHFNHVHASYDEGGILPPGTTIAHNNTGRNEYVMTGSQLAGPHVTVNVTVQGSVMAERDLAESIATSVRDALIRKANRNGGRLGL